MLTLLVLGSVPAAAQAELKSISDDVMSEHWGQALIEVTNVTQHTTPVVTGTLTPDANSKINGYDVSGVPKDSSGTAITGDISYSKLRIGAEISLDSEIGKLRLGGYNNPNFPTQAYDVNSDALVFTGYQKDGVYYPFTIKNPYIEFAMRDAQDGSTTREILGVRIGFEEADGMLGLNLNALSGRTYLTSTQTNGTFTVNSYGQRSTGDGTATTTGGTATAVSDAYQKFDALCLGRTGAQGACGDSTDPTRDFFISFNKVSGLFYPKANGASDYTPTQQGVWLNLADNARIYQIKNMTGDLSVLNTSNPPIRRW